MSVTIGIPTVQGPHRLERCLSHIFKDDSVKRFNAEVIVVDDGSDKENLDKNKFFCKKYNVKLYEQNFRSGVPKAWNRLVKEATFENIILLNDDIEVMNYWIDVILYTLYNNPKIGAVGLPSYEGVKKEIFQNISYTESKILFGSYNHPLLSCCGSAFGFRKSDWEFVGGFDERYFCFYEEIDFCLSLMKIGKRPVMLNYPALHHYVAETTTTVLENPQDIMIESQLKFEEKWQIEWKDIRQKFNSETIIAFDTLNEWNSVLGVWH